MPPGPLDWRASALAAALLLLTAPAAAAAGAGDAPPPASGPASRPVVVDDGPVAPPGFGGDAFIPPVELGSPAPVYPEAARAAGAGGVVVLFADVLAGGGVKVARVLRSATAELDRAAVEATEKLRFEPARLGGAPRTWRIEVRWMFDPADGTITHEVVTAGRADLPGAGPESGSSVSAPPGAGVPATRPAPPHGWDDAPASPSLLPAGGRLVVAGPLAPATPGLQRWRFASVDPADWIRHLPGVAVTRLPGAGRAPLLSMRGSPWDAGGDVAISLDGIPINAAGHALGPGYADLAFLPPELLSRVEIDRGPFDPSGGDFNSAGALRLHTLDKFEDSTASLSLAYPPFAPNGAGVLRALVLASPTLPAGASAVLVAEGFVDGGFTESGSANRYSVFARARTGGLSLTVTSYATGWRSPGLVPAVGLPGAPDRDARYLAFDATDGGATSRHGAVLRYEATKPGSAGASGLDLAAHVAVTRLTLWENRTGFLFDPCPSGLCTGDQVEHIDRRVAGGVLGRWYGAGRLLSGIRARFELGIDTRFASAELARRPTVARERFCPTAASPCVGEGHWRTGIADVAAYGRAELHFWTWGVAGVAMRSAYLLYDVEDELENVAVPGGPTSGTAAFGLALPAAWLSFLPHRAVEVFARGGLGIRSPDPRVVPIVVAGQAAAAPARAPSAEIGVRFRPTPELDFMATAFGATWEEQVDYDPAIGAAVVRPGGVRYGGDLIARYRIRRWLAVDFAVTAAWGKIRPSGGLDPVPLQIDAIPVLAGWAGVVAEHPSGMGALVRMRYVGPRPLAEGARARGAAVLDAAVGLHRESFSVLLLVENALASAVDDAQLHYTSLTEPAGEPLAGRHYTPVPPLTAAASVEVRF